MVSRCRCVFLIIYLPLSNLLKNHTTKCGKKEERCGRAPQKKKQRTHRRNKKEEEMELDHIALIVSKEENLAFYEKLGFKEK